MSWFSQVQTIYFKTDFSYFLANQNTTDNFLCEGKAYEESSKYVRIMLFIRTKHKTILFDVVNFSVHHNKSKSPDCPWWANGIIYHHKSAWKKNKFNYENIFSRWLILRFNCNLWFISFSIYKFIKINFRIVNVLANNTELEKQAYIEYFKQFSPLSAVPKFGYISTLNCLHLANDMHIWPSIFTT